MNFCKKCGKPFEPRAGYKNYCSNVCKIKKPVCKWGKGYKTAPRQTNEEYKSLSIKIGEHLGI